MLDNYIYLLNTICYIQHNYYDHDLLLNLNVIHASFYYRVIYET